MIALALLLQAAPAAPASVPSPAPSISEAAKPVKLWRDLELGMTPAQVATKMAAMDGVASATVVMKKKVPIDVSISYKGNGLQIGEFAMNAVPIFESGKLTSVRLVHVTCNTQLSDHALLIGRSLKEKYGEFERWTLANPGVGQIDKLFVFVHDDLRVVISFYTQSVPPPEQVYNSGSGWQGALASIANASNVADYNARVAACPNDGGTTTSIYVTYSAQAEFLALQAAEKKQQEANAQARKDGL